MAKPTTTKKNTEQRKAQAHTALVNNALEAVRLIHKDTSVPLPKTFESLRTVQRELNELISAVSDDIEANT